MSVPPPAPSNEHPLERRLVAMEELMTHLDRVLQELNEVVLNQQQRLERLETRWSRMANELEIVSQHVTEPRTLEDDKPPHY